MMNHQGGDRVDAFERDFTVAHRAASSDNLQCLAGVRERQARHGDGFQATDLVAAVGGTAPAPARCAAPGTAAGAPGHSAALAP
ncbi:hypothetical protein GCM10011578_066590 [Streptomyces fuscichromogenes]|uniref:Uncharacterized protein n=1 Tax=Streptomyces fuscichromogenes TaxID=1324013 RepID=A0A918CUN0_9ACTN|nr:hypothetical protein GCM10011578_066590 [Streptomyces fuscichromogenes]